MVFIKLNKGLIVVSVLAALFSNPLLADKISGGPRVNMVSGQLVVPCAEVDDPGSELDGRYFDVKFEQIGNLFDFIFGEEEDEKVCIELIEASLSADEDTSDINGDLGSELGSATAADLSPEDRCEIAKLKASWRGAKCLADAQIKGMKEGLTEEKVNEG